jgi:hypothetical protein
LLTNTGNHEVHLHRGRGESSPLWIWEQPIPGDKYYIGADAARGNLDTSGTAQGDFSAAVGWNGITGNQAFTYAAREGVDEFAWKLNSLARWYNKALVNVEQTGGDGSQVNKILRDRYHYPALYGWLGKDDKRYKHIGRALGWETTYRSRQKMLIVFREFIRPIDAGAKHGFLKVRDKRLLVQMGFCMRDDLTVRWEIKRGHDDIFVAAAIAAVALDQYPPPKSAGESRRLLERQMEEEQMPLDYDSEPHAALREKWWQKIKGRKPKTSAEDRLEGIW